MGLEALTARLEAEIEDPEEGNYGLPLCILDLPVPHHEESCPGPTILTSTLTRSCSPRRAETFLLYSQPIPSQNLGFIDPKAQTVEVSVGDRDYTLHQSPTVLSSNRAGGTTGAVLWKVTPLFAQWLAAPDNILLASGALGPSAAVLELGCGISPLNALALAPRVARYVLSDQPYVQKLVQQNISENRPSAAAGPSSRNRGKGRVSNQPQRDDAVVFRTLDWETDEVTPSLTGVDGLRSFDAVVACDCVFNYALVRPFVQTCVDVCRLRTAEKAEGADDDESSLPPCLCIVAQQLRNDEVFQSWLTAFHQSFRVWKIPDEMLPEALRSTAGFVVHVGVLRDE